MKFVRLSIIACGVAAVLLAATPASAQKAKTNRLDTSQESFTQDVKRPEKYKTKSGVEIRNSRNVDMPKDVKTIGNKEFNSTTQYLKVEFIPYKPNFETINDKSHITVDTDVQFRANFVKNTDIAPDVTMDVKIGKPTIRIQVDGGKPVALKAGSLFSGVKKHRKSSKGRRRGIPRLHRIHIGTCRSVHRTLPTRSARSWARKKGVATTS